MSTKEQKFECLAVTHVGFRLSARIADLRMAGNKIFSHMVERNGKHVAEYYMGATRKLT